MEKLFAEGLARRLPGFEPVKVDAPVVFGGVRVWRWNPVGDFVGFVLLVPNPTGHQTFTIEIGWSGAGRFPEIGMRPSIILGPDDPSPVDVAEGVVRLGDLASRSDLWWSLPDPAVEQPGSLSALMKSTERVPAKVAAEVAEGPVTEALALLELHGIAFLEEVAAARVDGRPSPREP